MDLFEHAHVDAPRTFSMTDRGHYPDAPGYRQTDTSKAAAKEIQPSSDLLRGKVLECLEHFKHLTADECARFLDIDKLSIRPRFSELKEQGLIYDSGERRSNDSGRRAIVWRRSATN